MSAPGRGIYGPHQYRQYIQSAEWRAVRERYWASKLPKNCFVCDGPRVKGMHLHHRTYKNLGAERLMDLVPVCPRCHDFIHELAHDPYWKKRGGLWAATKEAQRRMHPAKMRTPGKTQRGPGGGPAEQALIAQRPKHRQANRKLGPPRLKAGDLDGDELLS